MKKSFALTIFTFVFALLITLPVAATELHFEEGIFNEKEYHEVIFLTGEPVLLKGTVTQAGVGGRGKTNNLTTSLTYRLESADGNIKLNRTATFTSETEKKMDGRQTIYNTKLERLSETVTVGKEKFSLSDFQYSRSALLDSQPAVDYFSGTWTGRKTYTLGKNGTKAVVEVWGDTVGYNHAWGSTETQRIDGTVRFVGDIVIEGEKQPQEWSGTYQVNLSFNKTRDLTYHPNEPTPISFSGGYIETIQEDAILRYNSNMPEFDKNGLVQDSWGRKYDSGTTRLATMPTQRRLPVPLFRDLDDHWAREPILELASLEAFAPKGDYFGPRLDMTRGEYAYSMSYITDLLSLKAGQEQQAVNPFESRNKEVVEEESPFSDVGVQHEFYKEIKQINDAGVMVGVAPGRFAPDSTLTRAEAITTLIKALGFEKLAPLQNTITPFNDDDKIPFWARDAIYMAAEMGIVAGDTFGNVLPGETMSRAEAATFLQ
ncbi:MAG: S-layer homology domain-containing protein, partial [Bacillota bacterium]